MKIKAANNFLGLLLCFFTEFVGLVDPIRYAFFWRIFVAAVFRFFTCR